MHPLRRMGKEVGLDFIPVGGGGFSLQAPEDFISTVYMFFFHTATDLETARDSLLEQIEVETGDGGPL